MKNKFEYLILLILSVVSANQAIGQETNFASNVNRYFSLDGKQLVIKYDLPYSDANQLFNIILKIYFNDKVIQPQDNTLTGSWGIKVTPGIEKVILWDLPNDFTQDISKVTVEVIAMKMSMPSADFEYKILSAKTPFEVQFENKSKNADLYSWKFGDFKSPESNLSTQKSPVHVYESRGSYNVGLTASSQESNTSDSIMKIIKLGTGNEQELQKHKKLKNIWLGSAIASAGIGVFCLIEYNSVYNDWKEKGTSALKQKYKSYETIGVAALVGSAVCISQVIIQSKKIGDAKKAMKMSFIPLDKGGIVALAWTF